NWAPKTLYSPKMRNSTPMAIRNPAMALVFRSEMFVLTSRSNSLFEVGQTVKRSPTPMMRSKSATVAQDNRPTRAGKGRATCGFGQSNGLIGAALSQTGSDGMGGAVASVTTPQPLGVAQVLAVLQKSPPRARPIKAPRPLGAADGVVDRSNR